MGSPLAWVPALHATSGLMHGEAGVGGISVSVQGAGSYLHQCLVPRVSVTRIHLSARK